MTKKRVNEIIRFCMVGGLSFIVDYGLLYVCTEFFSLYYLYSSAISFTVSVFVNYWLCIAYVFENAKQQNKKQAAVFIGSSIIGLGLNQFCMWIFVSIIGAYYMVAKIFATAIVTIWNYVMKRKAVNDEW